MTHRLSVRTVEKPWGVSKLPPPFACNGGKRIGEIWFKPPIEMPELLVKYIFTSEKLSVQTHPNNAQAKKIGLATGGKDECWLVVAAEPNAQLGIGFVRELDETELRQAALDGSIEDLLVWRDVVPGAFFYIPANTVHAIGAGVTVLEIQQNSDTTYRLYDYGRPRELHLEEGIAVASRTTYDPKHYFQVPQDVDIELVNGPFFQLYQFHGSPDQSLLSSDDRPALVIPLDGSVSWEDDSAGPGECAVTTVLDEISFDDDVSYIVARAVS